MSQQVNLFNPLFLRKKQYFTAAAMAQSLALIALACVALGVQAERGGLALAQQANASKKQVDAVQARLSKATADFAPRQKDKSLSAAITTGEASLQSLRNAAGVLQRGDFGDTKGFSEFFKALARQSAEGMWLTNVVVGSANGEFGIRGKALRPELVPAYFNRLAQEPVMQGKSFEALDIAVPNTPASSAPKAQRAAPQFVSFSLQSKFGANSGGSQQELAAPPAASRLDQMSVQSLLAEAQSNAEKMGYVKPAVRK